MENILITGGRGLIGSYLIKKLQEKGYHVAVLSRSAEKNSDIQTYTWNPDRNEIEKGAVETADFIIHLAGANIVAKRWTGGRKHHIRDSRIKTGRLLFEKIKENKNRLKAFISASAIGYYGAVTSDRIFYESDPPSSDFLGETCRQWEESADRFNESDIRTVKIRTGILLAKHQGVLAKMTIPVKMGIGSALGNGKQYMPWIHIDDLCAIYIRAVEDVGMRGAYNAVAPQHITNKEFVRTLAKVLEKPFWFPDIPSIALAIVFGKMSDTILKGSRVSSEKISKAGYKFIFPDLEGALKDLFMKK